MAYYSAPFLGPDTQVSDQLPAPSLLQRIRQMSSMSARQKQLESQLGYAQSLIGPGTQKYYGGAG